MDFSNFIIITMKSSLPLGPCPKSDNENENTNFAVATYMMLDYISQ